MSNGNNFGSMVEEGALYARGLPAHVQGAVIASRVLAGSIGGLLKNLLGQGDAREIAAILTADTYPFTTTGTAGARTGTQVRVGTFGDFITTAFTMVVTSSDAPAAVSAYDFQLQLVLGRTEIQFVSNNAGVHVGELMTGMIASGTTFNNRYAFTRAVRIGKGELMRVVFTQLTANARVVYGPSFHGYYGIATTNSSLGIPA